MNLQPEQIELLREVLGALESKVRHVRTPAGADHFNQPIGAVIVADAVPSAPSITDDVEVVETIQLFPEETPVGKLSPGNLIGGIEPTLHNKRNTWEDLMTGTSPADGRLEMASSMMVDRVEGTEDEGRIFTDRDEIENYIDELFEEIGYGKRWLSISDNEDYLPDERIKAAISRGQTETLAEDHPLYGTPVPVLMHRKKGISEVVLLHEIAHILEGSWKDPGANDGHNWEWWETWGQLLKIKGLTVSRNYAQFFGASMEGIGVFNSD